MIRKFAFCLIYIHTCTVAYSQNNFKEAYIITLENDTVYGYANFRSDELNLSICEFKETSDSDSDSDSDTTTSYKPFDILGYSFINENKVYTSQEIEFGNVKRSTFLEYLVKGENASLFYYEYMKKQIYFVKDIYGDFRLLSKEDDKKVNALTMEKDVSFRRKLYEILGYNGSMQSTLKKTEFNRRSLSKAIQEYNEITCGTSDACVVYKAPQNIYIKLNYAFYGGGNKMTINLDKTQYDLLSSPITPEIGAQLILSYPRISNSMALVADISLSQLKNEIMSKTPSRYTYEFSATALKCNIGFKYTYPKGKFRPGFGLGFGRMYFINQDIKTSDEKYNLTYWSVDSYTEFTCNLGLDYVLENNHSVFVQINYATELDYLIFPRTQQNKYILGARLGYQF